MTNRQAAAAKTREKLIETAKAIICKKGLSGTSIDEITEACGVAKGTFYTYFKRKEDIVFELSRDIFDEILREAKESGGPIAERLQNYMVRFSAHIEKSSLKLCQEWIKNVADPALIQNEYDRNKMSKDITALRELLETAVESGQLRSDTPAALLAHTINDILYGQMLCWCMSGGAYSFASRTEEFCRNYLPLLLQNYLI